MGQLQPSGPAVLRAWKTAQKRCWSLGLRRCGLWAPCLCRHRGMRALIGASLAGLVPWHAGHTGRAWDPDTGARDGLPRRVAGPLTQLQQIQGGAAQKGGLDRSTRRQIRRGARVGDPCAHGVAGIAGTRPAPAGPRSAPHPTMATTARATAAASLVKRQTPFLRRFPAQYAALTAFESCPNSSRLRPQAHHAKAAR